MNSPIRQVIHWGWSTSIVSGYRCSSPERLSATRSAVQGRFRHAGNAYALWVTDPAYERQYLAKRDGDYQMGECHLTVSLGEPFGGAIYKLIASIITAERR